MKNLGFAYQPGQGEPIADSAGRVTRVWSNYFAKLALVQTSDELRDLYLALAERVGKLEDGQALTIIGRNSVKTVGTGQVEIQLVGDEDAPGSTEYYGTNAAGEKGFHPVADAIEVEVTELTKEVGLDGIITLGLADVPDSGMGTLQRTQFDAKGRKTGTSSATTDDLPEGSTNRYFPEAPIDGKQYARRDAAWTEVDAISIQFPFYATSGAFDPVPLTANRELPFFLTNGTQANIPMVTA
jgi:hypothetical protein